MPKATKERSDSISKALVSRFDLTGKTFGYWQVLRHDPARYAYGVKWICTCLKCNTNHSVIGSRLRTSKTLMCFACSKGSVSLIGRKFGKWTVVSKCSDENLRRLTWNCVCSCGTTGKLQTEHLKRSSGCKKCFYDETTVNFYSEDTLTNFFFCYLAQQAKLRNIDFDLNITYLQELYTNQNGKCNLSGIDIVFSKVKHGRGTASLDRIDSNKAYIEGNVQWVHKDVNIMKNVFSESRFIELCRMIASKHS